jgi:hypothetical protein
MEKFVFKEIALWGISRDGPEKRRMTSNHLVENLSIGMRFKIAYRQFSSPTPTVFWRDAKMD